MLPTYQVLAAVRASEQNVPPHREHMKEDVISVDKHDLLPIGI